MWRALLISLVLGVFGASLLTAACPCVIQYGACDEARQSNAVFIGTVESIAPPFLDPYARAKAMASLPAAETARLQGDSAPEALEKLKKIYLEMFTGVPDYARSRITDAHTQSDLEKAFEVVQSEGRVARFRVKTMFRRADDDDKPAAPSGAAAVKDDDDNAPQFLDVWTGSGECGFNFQAGETYLVYAIEDEDSGRLETSVCMRTRRLSDEKGDLAFLYFLKNAEKESTRLEGFVSTSFADQSVPRYESAISAPSPNAILELDTGAGLRYTTSDGDGHFSFDGLKESDYRLSLLGSGYPQTPRTVILSRMFHAAAASCARQIFVLPKSPKP